MDTPKKIGRYEILEELGHGAMGTVYRAKDPAMDRVVALKTIISLVLASDRGSDFRERFYREARAAGLDDESIESLLRVTLRAADEEEIA